MVFGLPKVITSDQGREFHNSLNEGIMKLMGIDHRLATPHHPQVSCQSVVTVVTVSRLSVVYTPGFQYNIMQ